jgi:toxin ParE1/3/4
MDHSVIFTPEALADLHAIAARAPAGLLARVEAWCWSLGDEPERGVRRDDLHPGLRLLGFEGRGAIAFHIGLDSVTIDRVVLSGRPAGPRDELTHL